MDDGRVVDWTCRGQRPAGVKTCSYSLVVFGSEIEEPFLLRMRSLCLRVVIMKHSESDGDRHVTEKTLHSSITVHFLSKHTHSLSEDSCVP